ncbi:hypothetical protein K466DRAFT_359294 [Polyporus arcularius HHB13444]|uniref:Uncharacterized protein n=1 Tax=Polyporus arcularius HHB13444 TaxID=1314778 RepID=A0A5C3PMH2_9APHY|nr:hypothetical protein K466DRAFT_359294 [Polyporus arcularius HHB13444]
MTSPSSMPMDPRSSSQLMKVHAVSIQGEFPFLQKETPVPGSDMAGEIVALGEDVTGWKPASDFVSTSQLTTSSEMSPRRSRRLALEVIYGVLTEYKVLPAHALVRIPERINYEEAATLPCAALTGYSTLIGTNLHELVQGRGRDSGPRHRRGLELRSPARRRLRRTGHRHIVNCQTVSDWDAEVLQITKGRGVDHVIEVGRPQTLLKSVNCVRYGGTTHIIDSS